MFKIALISHGMSEDVVDDVSRSVFNLFASSSIMNCISIGTVHFLLTNSHCFSIRFYTTAAIGPFSIDNSLLKKPMIEPELVR